MRKSIHNLLSDCLEAIENGQASLEECVENYPEHGAELRELLSEAIALRSAAPANPPPQFKRNARQHLMKRLIQIQRCR